MNVVSAVRNYIIKMVENCGAGSMKIFLLDQETTMIVSMVFTLSELSQREVYLFKKLSDTNREEMKNMKCIVFVRPTSANISLLAEELKHPKYPYYYVYFSNVLSKSDLKTLAEADEHEVVREVQGLGWRSEELFRSASGLTSLLLALKKCPMIRYQNSSEMAREFAEKLKHIISKEAALFDFRQLDVAPILLILDRKQDSITPLLNQWTYQAMVHELLTITNNRVDLSNVPGISSELEQVVLSAEQDEFYAKNFIQTYPEYKKKCSSLSKHVAVVGELSRRVQMHNLLEISEVEQDLSTQSNHSELLQKVKALILNPKTTHLDAARLVMLYSLKYEKHSNNDITGLLALLTKKNVPEKLRKVAGSILDYGGSKIRGNEMFGVTDNPIKATKKFFSGLKGVENIYTQHEPAVKETLELLIKNKLKETQFPYVGNNSLREKVRDVIVFIVGGTTYEEVLAVHSLNIAHPNVRIIIGGTCIHNTTTFLNEVIDSLQNSGRIGNAY